MRSTFSIAEDFVPYGAPVTYRRGGDSFCHPCTDIAQMVGIARRAQGRVDGPDPNGYHIGERVEIQTDGGIRALLLEDADLIIDGLPVRLKAADPHYFELENGKVVG